MKHKKYYKDFPNLLKNLNALELLDLSNNKIHDLIPNWFTGMSEEATSSSEL